MTSIHLLYAPENRDLADRLTADLGRAGIMFEHHTLQPNEPAGRLSARMEATGGPVLWLLTDNFLKNPLCMAGAWKMYQTLSAQRRLLTVVADGREQQPHGTYRAVSTHFDRAGEVVRYMNYWQEIFLKSTDRLRDAPLEQREAYDREVEVYRLIANDIGELFTALREAGYVRWDAFRADDYALFFQHFGLLDRYHAYRGLAALDAEAPPVTPAEIPAASAPIAPPVFSGPIRLQPVEDPVKVAAEAPVAQPEHIATSPAQPTEPALRQDDETSIRQAIRDAWTWIEKGYPQRGIEMLRQLTEQHPGHAIALAEYHRARAHFAQPEPVATTPVESPAPSPPLSPKPSAPSNGYAPTEADAYNAMGENAAVKGDHLLAKYCWDRVADLDPHYPKVFLKLADLTTAHLLNDYPEAAIYYIEQALVAEPDNADLHYRYAVLLRDRLNQSDRARQLFGVVVALRPDHADAWLALAELTHAAGDLKQAHDLYQHAGSLDPHLRTAERDTFFAIPAPETPPAPTPEQVQPTAEAPKQRPTQVLTVLITGATSGIGLATAEVFARHGHRLLLVGRRADRLEALRERLTRERSDAAVLTLPFDVRNANAVAEYLNHLPEGWDEIDILINNAGLAKGLAPIHEGSLEHWDTMIDTNIKGLLYVTRAVAPGMVQRRRGHIINVSSSAGKEVYPSGNVYCATKFAVEALTRGMRLDLHAYGIRVSQVSPGHTEDTEFALTRFDGDTERARIYEDFQPLKAADVAEAIYFIATRPPHVNVQDIWMYSTQQASATMINRSGRL